MTTKGALYLMLMLFSWTALSAQTPSSDSTICYTRSELQKIAIALVNGKECQDLYKLKTQEVAILDSMVTVLQLDVVKADAQRDQYKLMAEGYATEASQLREVLTAQQKKNKWLRIGLGATVGALVGVLTYFSFR